jgi:uncharacterized membrane protein YkvI
MSKDVKGTNTPVSCLLFCHSQGFTRHQTMTEMVMLLVWCIWALCAEHATLSSWMHKSAAHWPATWTGYDHIYIICDCFFDLSCLVDLSCIGRSNRKAYSRWLWWEQLIKTVVPLAWDWKHLLPKHRVTICIHMWPLSLTYPMKSVGRSRIVTSLIPKSRFFSLLLCCSCVVSVTIRSHATKASPLQELQIGSNKSL